MTYRRNIPRYSSWPSVRTSLAAAGSGTLFGKGCAHVARDAQNPKSREAVFPDVKTLTGTEATLAAIREGLEWLAQHATPSDVAIVYFAAAATQNEWGEALVLPSDARGSMGGLPASDFQSLLTKIRGQLLLWADWRSATASARTVHDFCLGTVTESQFAGAAVDDLLRDLVGTDQGVAVMSANSGTATAGAVPPANAIGWFAQAIAEGLSGRAAADGTAGVSLSELEEYVKQRVGELSGNRWRPNVGRSPLIPPVPLTK